MKRVGNFLVKWVYVLEYPLRSPDGPVQILDTQFT